MDNRCYYYIENSTCCPSEEPPLRYNRTGWCYLEVVIALARVVALNDTHRLSIALACQAIPLGAGSVDILAVAVYEQGRRGIDADHIILTEYSGGTDLSIGATQVAIGIAVWKRDVPEGHGSVARRRWRRTIT